MFKTCEAKRTEGGHPGGGSKCIPHGTPAVPQSLDQERVPLLDSQDTQPLPVCPCMRSPCPHSRPALTWVPVSPLRQQLDKGVIFKQVASTLPPSPWMQGPHGCACFRILAEVPPPNGKVLRAHFSKSRKKSFLNLNSRVHSSVRSH